MAQVLEMESRTASGAIGTLPFETLSSLACAAFDAIDYGVVLVGADGGLEFANAAAQAHFGLSQPLWLDAEGEVRARLPSDDQRLAATLKDVRLHGLRRMLSLGENDQTIVVAMIGLADLPAGRPRPCLVLINRDVVCEPLSVDLFARLQGLTPAESHVLSLLTSGHTAAAVAQQLGIQVSTARTHIRNLLSKTGCRNTRRLAQVMSTLPPVAGVLRFPRAFRRSRG